MKDLSALINSESLETNEIVVPPMPVNKIRGLSSGAIFFDEAQDFNQKKFDKWDIERERAALKKEQEIQANYYKKKAEKLQKQIDDEREEARRRLEEEKAEHRRNCKHERSRCTYVARYCNQNDDNPHSMVCEDCGHTWTEWR